MIFIGKILKVRGNKGEVVITSPRVGVHALAERTIITLKSEKYEKKCDLVYLKEINGTPIIKLKGIDSINEALKLVGYSVYAETNEKKNDPNSPLADSEDFDLTGFLVKDLNGDQWGNVISFETESFNELLEILDENENETYYVPFTEAIIKEIDKEKRLITIDPPDGLKSLNKK
ncbi:MAG: rRNA processing protein RimM [Acidobacteriota bacterium]|nr:rRNA processing protein RimM [Acidobacteriota bacterium]